MWLVRKFMGPGPDLCYVVGGGQDMEALKQGKKFDRVMKLMINLDGKDGLREEFLFEKRRPGGLLFLKGCLPAYN